MTTKSQFVDTAALFKRLDRQARQWMRTWKSPLPDFYARDTDLLRQYLAGTKSVRSLACFMANLSTDHEIMFESDAVLQDTVRWDQLALSARYALSSVLVSAARAEADPAVPVEQVGQVLFSVAQQLSEVILIGWREQAQLLLKALLRGLGNNLLALHKDRVNHATQFYFLIQLGVEHFGPALPPQEVFRFAQPQDMPAYAPVLAEWRTTDLGRVQEFVNAMAEHHVRESKSQGGVDGAFCIQSDYLFPYEILAFLRMREWAGLENPKSFEHPLMNTSLAVLPPAPLPWPDDPLLDAAIAKFKTEYPAQNYLDRLAAT